MKKDMRNAWLLLFIFICGRAIIGEYNPFIIPLVMAAYLKGWNVFICAVAAVGGFVTNGDINLVIRYGSILALICLFIFVENIGKQIVKRERVVLCAMIITGLSDVTFGMINGSIEYLYIVCEAVMVICLEMIFEKAIEIIKNDFESIVISNEALISVSVLYAISLYALPVDICGVFRVAEAVGVYIILYAIYRFGIGIGSLEAIVGGIILMIITGERDYLLFLIMTAIVCGMISAVIKYKKIGIALGLVITIGFFSYQYWPYVTSEAGIKAFLSALIAFLITPAVFMTYVDKNVQTGNIYGNSDEWGRMMMDKVSDFAKAFRRIEYTIAGNESTGITFSEIGDVIEDFTTEFDNVVPVRKKLEAEIIYDLSRKNAIVKNIIMLKNNHEHYEIYITLKMRRGRLITSKEVREIIEERLDIPLQNMNCSRNVVSKEFTLLAFMEKPPFTMEIGIKKISKYESGPSGDNYSYFELKNGQTLMLLSDGMGSGKEACSQSEILISTIEELLQAGFDNDLSVKFINSYLSRRNKGEIFATLDMLITDCFTGYGRIYKQGAAATFVKRGDWIEVIKSTSLPVGVEESAECEMSIKKFYENDIVVMVSDGVLESIIFENKEDYLKDIIRKCDSVFAEEIAEELINEIKNLNGRNLKDDATVLVGVLRRK